MRCVGLTAFVLLTGCYRYTPIAGPSLVAGEYVRVSFTPAGAQRLRPTLGPNVTAAEGQVRSLTDGDVVLSTTATIRASATSGRMNWAGEHVTISYADIAGSERRTLDRRRTTSAVALGAVVAILAARALITRSSSGGDDGGGPVVIPP